MTSRFGTLKKKIRPNKWKTQPSKFYKFVWCDSGDKKGSSLIFDHGCVNAVSNNFTHGILIITEINSISFEIT